MTSETLQIRVRQLATVSLICMFLIVIAGSFVRITGSGMGCPDWPKCFGYYIPPTEENTIRLEEGRTYTKGEMVIYNDTLWIAENTFQYSTHFWTENKTNKLLKPYPKHQYAIFNVFHTWTEYINRLLTAFLGLPIFMLVVVCYLLSRKTKNYKPLLLSSFTVLMILFEAWLGKLVVDKNLEGSQITLHMVGTLGILFSLVILIVHTSSHKPLSLSKTYQRTLWLLLLMVVFQILLGTQVREIVDVAFDNHLDRNLWLSFLLDHENAAFKIHRSFSWFIVIAAAFLFFQYQRFKQPRAQVKLILMLIATEILIGITLSYFNFKIILQPVHLLLSMCLSAAIMYEIQITRTHEAVR